SSYSYLTNSRCAVSAKSLIGNTDLNTACKPSLGRAPFGASLRRNWSYDAFCTSIRFGISPTSLTCPKTLRTRLRPVNVCAMSFLNAHARSAIARLRSRQAARANRSPLSIPRPGRAHPRAPLDGRNKPNLKKRRNGPGAERPGTVPTLTDEPHVGPACSLLELNLGADLLQSGLDLLGLVLGDAFLDGLRRAFDQILGLLEAERGDRADFLDDLDLLVADGGQDDGELGLLFDRSGGGGRSGGHRHGGGGRNAPFGLEQLGELGGFKNGQTRQFVDD